MGEDSKTPRTAQIAMLGAAAACLILAAPSEAVSRIEAAKHSIDQLAAVDLAGSARDAHKAAGEDPVDWIDDLPSTPSAQWFADHRSPGVSGAVYTRSYRTATKSTALADLCAIIARKSMSVEDAETTDAINDARPSCSWRALRVVDDAPDWGVLKAATGADDVVVNSRKDLRMARLTADDATTALAGARRDWGVAGRQTQEADQQLGATTTALQHARKRWNEAESGRESARKALEEASGRARNAKAVPAGRYVLIACDAQRFYVIAEPQAKPMGSCSGPDVCVAPDGARLLDLAPWVSTVDAPVSIVSILSSDHRSPFSFAVEPLIEAGVWNDVRDRDFRSAQAVLADARTKAELEGEIFGVKVHQEDAVNWAWLPVLCLWVYGLLLLRESRRAAHDEPGAGAEAPDWWASAEWQCVVGLCALGAIGISLVHGLGAKPVVPYGVFVAAAFLLIAGYDVASRVRGHHRRQRATPTPSRPPPDLPDNQTNATPRGRPPDRPTARPNVGGGIHH